MRIINCLTILILCATASISNAATTIDAQVVRNQTGSGSTFISSGFPFPPGLVTESMITGGRIKVLIGATEYAANVTALRGRHSDGTLRSALIQFTVASMAQNDVLTASVIVDGGVRATSDPAYVRPTLAIVQNNNVILPTDPGYITTTLITFQHLLPAAPEYLGVTAKVSTTPTVGGTIAEENLFTALADNRFDALIISNNEGTARYEESRGMVTLWARSGNIKFFNKAVNYTASWLEYNTPINNTGCVAEAYINPDARIATTNPSCGLPAEWQFSRVLSYATMYLLTGYRDYWSIVAHAVQREQAAITSQSIANTSVIKYQDIDFPRFNYAERYGAMIAALMIDATAPISGNFHTGRNLNFQTQFGYVLNAIEGSAWDLGWLQYTGGSGVAPANLSSISQGAATGTLLGIYADRNGARTAPAASIPASGWIQMRTTAGTFAAGALTTGPTVTISGPVEADYREGINGVLSYSPRTGTNTLPSFQLVFPSYFMIDYYLNVEADSRIPAMVKKNLDAILNNIRVMVSGDGSYGVTNASWGNAVYGKPYDLEIPVTNEAAYCYELPEYARMIAFVMKTLGDSTVNGSPLSTWYSRAIDTANISPTALTWQWKLFGQFYGFGADAPWIMAQTSLPTPVYRVPTYYASIPGDTPDLGRITRVKLGGFPIGAVQTAGD